MVLGANTKKSILAPREDCTVAFAMKNNSTEVVTDVTVAVTQTISWSAAGRTRTACRAVGSQKLASSEVSGTDSVKRDDRRKGLIEQVDINEMVSNLLRHSEENRVPGVQQGAFSITPDAYPTFTGSLIRAEHELAVTVNTGCCITDPRVSTPVSITTPYLNNAAMTPRCESFKSKPSIYPEELAGQNFVVAEAYAVDPKVMFVGGTAVDSTDGEQTNPLGSALPMFGGAASGPKSLASMTKEMEASIDDLNVVRNYVREKDGEASFLKALSAGQVADLLPAVDMQFDQPAVAELLVSCIEGGIDCKGIITILQKVQMDSMYPAVINGLKPYTRDFDQNARVIYDYLGNGFLQIICKEPLGIQ